MLRRLHPLLRVLSLALPLVASAAETLRVRADSWMPYNGDPASPAPGYAIDIVRAVFEPRGVTVDYQNLPWGDALKAAGDGGIEAVVGANPAEAKGLVLPKECIGTPRIALFARRTNAWRYENIASLNAVRLGVILDYKYWPTLDDHIARHDAPRVVKFGGEHPLEDALAALKAGEIDVLAETSSVFAWTTKSAGYAPGDFRIVYLHEGEAVFVAFTPRDGLGERYAAWFDAGVRELRRTGELQRILARYNQSDWQSTPAPAVALTR